MGSDNNLQETRLEPRDDILAEFLVVHLHTGEVKRQAPMLAKRTV